jgi:protein-tyrosine phosphatase
MIDLHGHYLPWVDDGPDSLDEALLMLRRAEADGVRLVVLTPTLDPGRAPVLRVELEKKFAAFVQLMERRGIRLRLRLGAELVHGPGVIGAIDRREVPFVGEWEGRRVVLLRWAEEFIPIGAITAVQEMAARGVLPMLAHPERNPGVVRSPTALELFLCDGCLIQVDAGSVLGWYGTQVRDTAFRLIEAGRVTVLASGATDASARPPMMRAARDALAQRFGEETAVRLTELNPSLVVAADLPHGFDVPTQADGAAAAANAASPGMPAAAPVDSRPMPSPTASGSHRRPDQEPVIAPADPDLPLMRF